MRAALRPSSLLIVPLIFLAGIVVGQTTPPLWKSALIATFQTGYQEATYRCDRAMRNHLVAKEQVYRSPGKDTVVALRAAEVALLDCQDYDMLRKRLILWGLDENDLSLMALQAIEAKDRDLQQVVEIHEIRR